MLQEIRSRSTTARCSAPRIVIMMHTAARIVLCKTREAGGTDTVTRLT